MREICTSGLMSGDGKRGVATRPKPPRPSSTLPHNDFRPANLHFEPSGRLVVLDWEAASLGPPGATLRFMARWPEAEQRQVVDLYCSHLAAKGIALRAEDVTFGMPASAVVQAVSFGAQQAGANRAPRKLKLLR